MDKISELIYLQGLRSQLLYRNLDMLGLVNLDPLRAEVQHRMDELTSKPVSDKGATDGRTVEG
jgi:hypothetical protein